jgi:phosphate-selective porin OprO/OprP
MEARAWLFAALLAIAPRTALGQDRQTPLTPTPGQGKLAIETDSFSLRLRGYLQADYRHVFGDGPWSDAFLIRRARAVFEGSAFHRVEVKIMADFAATPMLYDAYVDAKITDWLRLRFGKDKVPISIERLRSARNLLFVERAQPGVFTPVREIGAQIIAEPFDGRVSASAGVMQGTADGVNPDVFAADAYGDDKDVVGRVFVRPFSRGVFSGLGFGVSASIGSASKQLPSYKTTAQSTYFAFRTGAVAFDSRAHLGAQLHWTLGPAEVMAEAIESVQGVKLDAQTARLENGAYAVQLALVATGEKAAWEGVVPKRKCGAFVIAARTQGSHFDARVFPVFADPATAARSSLAFGGSLTWIWNSVFELQSTWETTTFSGGAKIGDRATEHALLMRAQAAF